MNAEKRLLLAYGIACYDSTLTHIRAVWPDNSALTQGIEGELNVLIRRWVLSGGSLIWDAKRRRTVAVAEARAYCTEHDATLNELLKRNGESEW